MNVLKMKLLTFLLLKVFIRNCSVLSSCARRIAPVELNPPDINEIISYIQSQRITTKSIAEVMTTELKIIEEAFGDTGDNEDIHLPIDKLVHKYGYKLDEYKTQTEDGYVLTLHRIRRDGPAVFLMHGLFCSSDDWITPGPVSALPYILASGGYDVWMGNARGNKHSLEHVTLSPECADFWDFSWDEIGRRDLPAMIDFVLSKTGQSKLFYIGFSQGTTAFFVMASELPDINEKISLMIALAPVAWMSHLKSPAARLLTLQNGLIYSFASGIGTNSFASNAVFTRLLGNVMCGDNKLGKIICSNYANSIFGFDSGQVNISNLPVIFGHFPSSVSSKQTVHYAQGIESAKFRQFDYGEEINIEKYGQTTPPDYPVERIEAPVAMFYSDVDWFSNITDVMILRDKMTNVVDFHFVDNYAHCDYLWAKNVKDLVHTRVLKLLKQYT